MRLGSLFSGYGGLDMACETFFGAETAWVSDIDKGACKILAHRYPDVPNIGDITKVDWTAVEPVDVLTGGFPCQDVSHAGKRAGFTPTSRSGLWTHMAYAISQLRPRYVVAENVRGLLSARADSDVESCPWCLGGASDGEPDLRALGAVLGDLAELGYDAQWYGLRASDVGAPHGRFRVFVVATDTLSGGRERRRTDGIAGAPDAATRSRDSTPTHAERSGRDGRSRQLGSRRWAEPEDGGDVAANPPSVGRDEGWTEPTRLVGRPNAAVSGTSTTADAESDEGWQWDGDDLSAGREGSGWRAAPAADARGERHGRGQDGGALGRLGGQAEGGARERERSRELAGDRGAEVAADADRVGRDGLAQLDPPKPSRVDGEHWGHWGHPDRRGDGSGRGPGQGIAWGAYEPAIRRWEAALGRVAPAPTETSPRGTQRLSPTFVEWMMGLPLGHVTKVPGLSRNEQLKALGNGVVPQQAYAALCQLAATQAVAA